MAINFIHLRLHTEYSLSDSLIRVEDLIEIAVENQFPAVAVTDQVNLFAAVKFFQEATAAGIKPIIGADILLHNPQNPQQPFRCTALCQNQQGYLNLTNLISRAYLDGQQQGLPLIEREWLFALAEGLLILSGGREGDIGQALLADKASQAQQLLDEWKRVFTDRFYLELQRTGRPQEEEYLYAALELAHQTQTPVLATNDVRFLVADDFEAHEARVCIHGGNVLDDPQRPKKFSNQQYLRSAEEMQKLFADVPSALTNTVEIAKRCNLELILGKTFLPNFVIPGGLSAEDYLRKQAEEGLEKRLEFLLDKNAPEYETKRKPYLERLEKELNVIIPMKFAGYFLIVADFIRWSKTNGIPVGPGRGSGAGSLVAYALLITDLDPLQYDLLFERFLNPERISMPDFDVDFCMEGRDRVIEYVTRQYGREAVAQIITFGSMAARGVLRDVGRVLGYPYGMMDKLAKLIPFEIGMTLEKALQQEPELQRRYTDDEEVKQLFDLARKLEGLARNVGKHAAGVVIAPSKLTDFTPLYCEAEEQQLVTQFDMDDIQAVGLVKFDFLGLRTLTIIDWAVQTINRRLQRENKELLDISKIPLDDPATFTLLKACATTAVFQFESRGFKDLIKRLQPDCFEDIIALGALFRPGPLQSGMVDDFINRKHGRAKVEYPYPNLEPILRPTYGIIVYQEQVLQIAQVLAGYTLGGADILRRAMGKKKPEEMAKQREIFVTGAGKTHGIAAKLASEVFDLMEKFAGYGFNKSHSAAYALLSYQTAWLKTHYPAEFMAAVLSSDMDHTEKVVALLEECKQMKLTVVPPNINQSYYKFTVTEDGKIHYGLGAIKGMGESAIENIIEAREQKGVFTDLFDFCQRVDLRKVNRRTFEALIRSGSFDLFDKNRASLLASLDLALQTAEQEARALLDGQHDLFGGAEEQSNKRESRLVPAAEWPMEVQLQGEKEVLGFYLSGHPLNRYRNELKKFTRGPLGRLDASNSTVMIAGWIISVRVMQTKRGDRMAVVTIEDESGRLDVTIFSEVFNTYKDLLNKDQLLIVEGEVSVDEYTGGYRVMARKLLDIQKAREIYARYLLIEVKQETLEKTFLQQMQQTLQSYCPGSLRTIIQYHREEASVQVQLGKQWCVKPSDELLAALNNLLGENKTVVVYS